MILGGEKMCCVLLAAAPGIVVWLCLLASVLSLITIDMVYLCLGTISNWGWLATKCTV